jgi:hypothetical protein
MFPPQMNREKKGLYLNVELVLCPEASFDPGREAHI